MNCLRLVKLKIFRFCPGAATESEAMRLLARGYDMLKFFPAEASGGVSALKAIGGPLPQVSFCPTGGVSAANAGSYLPQQNVVCAGGSWVAPNDLIAVGDWAGIETQAGDAAQLEVCK
ncbi:KHG/KDPG aldolase [Ruegeria atlantica]|uniref:KHG/KDPG aldolase n=1 Tax=Ruegeria atlantica TaxID=81569 RepID=A0A0P1EMP0_9RHOB|nr:KHG/KDPG aldolase [Ruegeria atlantica]